MAKLTKAQAKAHAEACAILAKDGPLTEDEKEFIARNWNEAANHINTTTGAHFTPVDMALDLALDIGEGRLLDLCAGIGVLGLAAVWRRRVNEEDLVCVELNPDYVAVGKRLLPKATWICADAFGLPRLGLGRFDTIVSNPPFGASAKKTGAGRFYTGPDFDLALLDLAADYADWLIFVLPQSNSAFRYSGRHYYDRPEDCKGARFQAQTGLHMDCGVGVDTSIFADQWKTTSVICEIVTVDVANSPDRQPLAVETVELLDGPAHQTLVPGVAPVSEISAQIVQLEAKRAKKRQASTLPAGGLFDETARAQLSLF